MSPTSYQTAPPRDALYTIAEIIHGLRAADTNTASAAAVAGYHGTYADQVQCHHLGESPKSHNVSFWYGDVLVVYLIRKLIKYIKSRRASR
jgi:hypothetical protein